MVGMMKKTIRYMMLCVMCLVGGMYGTLLSVEFGLNIHSVSATDEWAAYYSNGNFGLSSYEVTLFPGETYNLLTGNIGEVTYTSADNSIATVSSEGVITGVSIGTTQITVICSYGSRTCDVKVVEDNGQYIDTIDKYKFEVTTERTTTEYDRFVLVVDKGLYVSPGFPELVDNVMTAIEEVTRFKFYPDGEETLTTSEKIVVEAINGWYVEPCGWEGGVILDDTCVGVEDLTSDLYALVHELLHTAQMRNTGSAGALLTEGFAETYVDEVIEKLPYQSVLCEHDRMCNYPIYTDENYKYYYPYKEYGDQYIEVNHDTVEKIFLTTMDHHPTSYFMVRYMRDIYGDDLLYKLLYEVSTRKIADSIDDVYDLIKSETKETFIYDMCDWYNNQFDKSDTIIDYTEHQVVQPRFVSYKFVDQLAPVVAWYGLTIRYNNSLTIDFERIISYAQLILGKKVVEYQLD